MLADAKRLFRIRALLAIALAGVAASAGAKTPRDVERERSDIVRQLDEYKQRVQSLEERLRQLDAQSGDVTTEPAATAPSCEMPFAVDRQGIKHVRPECLEVTTQATCEMPFAVDRQGIRHVRPECLEVTTQAPCETPFVIDAQGIKHMRQGCVL